MLKKMFSSVLISMLISQVVVAAPPVDLPQNVRMDLSGTLQVFVRENLEEQSAELEYFLDRGRGQAPVKLVFAEVAPSDLRSGVGIAVRGIVTGDRFQVQAANLETGGLSTQGTSAEVAEAAVSFRSAAVVVVNLADSAHSNTDVSAMSQYYFGGSDSMSDIYDRISFGQLSVQGSVAAVVQSSRTQAEVCANPFTYANEFLTAAENANPGFNRADYQHRVFAIPRTASCGWTGYANVGCGTSCSAFNRWSHDINTTAHEFGHNLGMAHAGKGTDQYADLSSFMGYSLSWAVRALDGAHHWQMGWYSSIDPQAVEVISSSGTYQLSPLKEGVPSITSPSLYRINVANGNPYFLSTRVAEGYDSDLASLDPAAVQGINIHRYVGAGYGQTTLLAQLTNGESLSDGSNSLIIQQIDRAADGTLTFAIDMGEAECLSATPALSVSPSFVTVGINTSYTYSVTLLNQDSLNCNARSFSLGASEGVLTEPTLTLSAGSSGTTSITVTGAPSSTEKQITVVVEGEGVSAAATLTVDGTAPDEVFDLVGSYAKKGRNHRAQLNWSASPSLDVSTYRIYRDGVLLAEVSQTAYTDSLSSTLSDSYSYLVQAVDQVGNSSSGVEVVVETSSTGDTGGGGNGGGKGGGKGKK